MPFAQAASALISSLPVRGAWIEMERICSSSFQMVHGRSPCGERGLKYVVDFSLDIGEVSLPVRGAWIEIIRAYPHGTTCPVAPRAGSVD